MLEQKSEEKLEEFAERAQCTVQDAWPDASDVMLEEMSVHAFLKGCKHTSAAFEVMNKGVKTVDEALMMV